MTCPETCSIRPVVHGVHTFIQGRAGRPMTTLRPRRQHGSRRFGSLTPICCRTKCRFQTPTRTGTRRNRLAGILFKVLRLSQISNPSRRQARTPRRRRRQSDRLLAGNLKDGFVLDSAFRHQKSSYGPPGAGYLPSSDASQHARNSGAPLRREVEPDIRRIGQLGAILERFSI